MNDTKKTKAELIAELEDIRRHCSMLQESVKSRKTTEELRCNEDELLQRTFRAVSAGIGLISDCVIMEINNRFCRMVGYSRVELRHRNIRMLYISDDDYEYVSRELVRQIREYGTGTVETRMKCKDGRIIDLLLSFAPLDPSDHAQGITFTALDITDQKQKENEFKETRHRYSFLFENMGSGLAVYEPLDGGRDFRFKAFNPAAEAITRISRDKVIGSTLLTLFPNMDKTGLLDALRRVSETGRPEHPPPFYYQDNDRQGWRENHIYRIPSGEVVALFDDITGYWETKNALQKSEEKLRLLFDHIRDSVFVHPILDNGDLGRFEMVNAAACRTLGYTEEEFLQMSPIELDDPEQSSRYIPEATHHLLHDGQVLFEAVQVSKNGTGIPVEVSSNRVELSGCPYIISTVRDISGRKESERELQENRRFLQSIYEGVNHSIFVVDVQPDGTYRYRGINRQHETLTGISNAEIAGKAPAQVLEPFFAEEVVRHYDDCVHGEAPVRYEEQLPFRGRECWWETVLNPIRNKEGVVCRIIGTSTDITQHKHALAALKKLSVAVKQSPSVVVITGIDGTIEYVNPKFTDLTGYSATEVIGKNLRDVQSGMVSAEVYDRLWKKVLGGQEWHGEFYNKKKNGELYWEEAVIAPILNEEGVITNFVAVKEDVTEKKKLWSELIAAKEKAEESDRLKTAFLANLSHEIRTPMNGILGFSSLLKEPHLTGEEQEEFIGLIEQSGLRMLNIINELIDISRIEAGETVLQIAETSLNSLLHDLYAFFQPVAGKKGLRFGCFPGLSDEESLIETDSSKLNQILSNLIQNALKFTDEGYVDFGYTRQDGVLDLYVIDSGIGIPIARQEEIFDRFRQVDASPTRNFGGTGLGLSISRAFVEMLGGSISVTSIEGRGSEFHFTLPYNRSGSSEIADSDQQFSEKPLSLQDITILVVEDDPSSSILLKTILNGADIMTIHAQNGREAVEQVTMRSDIRMVLMDIKMPVMDGFEATRLIKQIRPGLPVIAQTAFALEEDREKSVAAGFDAFITKPIRNVELMELIERHLESPEAM
ncbi:MAG: PAS domain S-box protein [Chlorobium sp.]|uniref:PAS domain S-box protein n=1 Tax=Chlorobium sp. TaxID=1095 RepID=UPI0025C23C81|nr:PAS domain S-box protein [Chlorobium sp.]MCF8270532.1 PAS domain S-box protein [Chlorobium sp.]MCF8286944.1 PAS domain S-box protein [Chlorobium sp.]MCF8290540.1 PAS domain S-box protein [Chlorobium sp.]